MNFKELQFQKITLRKALAELERVEVSCKSCVHYEFRICQFCQAIPPEAVVAGEAPCEQWQHDGIPF